MSARIYALCRSAYGETEKQTVGLLPCSELKQERISVYIRKSNKKISLLYYGVHVVGRLTRVEHSLCSYMRQTFLQTTVVPVLLIVSTVTRQLHHDDTPTGLGDYSSLLHLQRT